MSTATTVQALGWRSIPATPKMEDIVKDETLQAVEPEGKNGWYSCLLLAISFILLLLGLLPAKEDGRQDVHLPDWPSGRTETSGGRE